MQLTVTETTITFVYGETLKQITHPPRATYEDIMKLVVERFEIPIEFKDFIQVSNVSNYIFTKETFEYFLVLFPQPKINFRIRVDYKKLLENLVAEARKPFINTTNKKHYDEFGYQTVSRQNCFIGVYPGTEEEQSSEPKRQRIGGKITTKAVKKASRRRTIRV